jgi:hypothetical protein
MSAGYAVFKGEKQVFHGARLEAALAAQALAGEPNGALVLIFDSEGRQVDFDLRGEPADLIARLSPADQTAEEPRGRGRPKLGVTAREVTLLPRHWDWLAAQPGGASVALRKLVEAARRTAEAPDRRRRSREVAYRFASVMAGDRPGFEEATRALFAGDAGAFEARISTWPSDVATHLRHLATEAFGDLDP